MPRPASPLPRRLTVACLVIAGGFLLSLPACKHEPLIIPEGPLGDGGSQPLPETECDPNIIYFEQQILPLLISNCAVPGCHDNATSDNDHIQITSYGTLMQSGIIGDGDLWEAINNDDPDDIMPRPPQNPLTAAQIALIGQWIQQGAQDNSCNGICDTTNVTYSGTILPLVQARCMGCHSGGSPQGNLDFSTWEDLHTAAMDGSLAGAVQHQDPYVYMPPSGPMLPSCRVDQFLIWIADGAPNN